MTDTSPAVAKLQSEWHSLHHHLDRARAVSVIKQSGTILHELVKGLNCSPSILRHLLEDL